MQIALIAKPGHANTGVGRYVVELERELQALGHGVTVLYPVVPLPQWLVQAIRHWLGWDLEAFFQNYPVYIRYVPADIYHITSQNLATLLLIRRPPGKTVVTVHDLIPWMTRHDPELQPYAHSITKLFDLLSIQALRRADHLLVISNFTGRVVAAVADTRTLANLCSAGEIPQSPAAATKNAGAPTVVSSMK